MSPSRIAHSSSALRRAASMASSLATRYDSGTAPTADAPLDVVRAFRVRFDLAVDAHLVLEPAVRFRDDRSETPSCRGFDFLDEVDALRVVGSIEKSAEGLGSRHPLILL